MQFIHAYNDGTRLCVMSAKMLLLTPPWMGQRILDPAHVRSIADAVGGNVRLLDRGYVLLRYEKEGEAAASDTASFIIDGQHRAQVLKDHFAAHPAEPDFSVTATIKIATSEEDALGFFQALNHAKPVKLTEEPALVANDHLSAVLAAFNGDPKNPLIRAHKTHAPYLSADAVRLWLRDVVVPRSYTARAAVAALRAANSRILASGFEATTQPRRSAVTLKFALGFSRPEEWTPFLSHANDAVPDLLL